MKQTIFERTPDAKVLFEFNGTRKHPVSDGYHPDHLIKEGYLTCGLHRYDGTASVSPNGTVTGTITFLDPEAYPHCLWVGKQIPIQEGIKVVGTATILVILNPLLAKA